MIPPYGSGPPDGGDGMEPGPEEPSPRPSPATRPGASTFTIEGRAAPALFVIGWLASVLGLGAVAIALLGGSHPAAPILLLAGLLVLAIGLTAAAGSQGIERRARAVSGYGGPSPFLVFGATVPTSLLIAVIVGIPLTFAGLPVDGPLARLGAVVAQAVVYAALIRLLVVDVGALSWADMGVRRPDGRATAELAGGALWAVPVILVTSLVAVLLTRFVPVTPVSPLPPTGEASGLIINLIAGAIVAPIGEELLFRGFATTAWARRIGDRRALVRGALFFAVVHVLAISGATAGEAVGLALVGFASRIPVGLALGWLYLRRGSIWAPIGLHATFNAILIVLGEAVLRSGVS